MKDDNKTKKQLINELTELRSQNAALKKSESADKYRSLVENIRDVIYELDNQGVVLYISPAVRDLLGYDSAEIIGKNFIELAHKDDLASLTEWFSELRKGREYPSEYRVINKSGELRWAQTKTRPIMEDGLFKGAHGILIDVTKQRQMEQALRESEEKYRLVVDNMADVIAIMDMNLRFTYVSPSIMHMRGYTAEEATAQTLEQVMTPESLRIVAKVFEEEMKLEASGMADPGRSRILEVQEYRKDGSIVWIENNLSFIRDEAQKPVSILSLSRDITDRKRAEAKLRQQTDAMEVAIDGMAILNKDGEYAYLNKAHAKVYGYENAGELIGKSWRILYDSDVLQRFDQEIMPELSRKGIWHGEAVGMKKNGSKFPQELSLTVMANVGLICIVRDITERRRAEDALRESEKKYRELYDFLPIPVYEMDFEANITSANRAIYETFRGTEEDLKKGFKGWQLLSPEDIDKSAKNIERLLKGEQVEGTEYSLKRLDGSVFPGLVLSSVIYDNDKPVGLRGAIVDITERKRAEEVLKESENKYRLLADNVNDVIFVLDMNLNYTYVSPSIKILWGYEPAEVVKQQALETLTPSSIDLAVRTLSEVMELEKSEHREILISRTLPLETIRKDGTTVWTEVKFSFIRDENQQPVGILGVTRDITDRRKAEDKVRESEERYRALFDHSLDLVYVTDFEGRFIDANAAALNRLGYTREEIRSLNFASLLSEDQLLLAIKTLQEIRETGIHKSMMEFRLRHKNGSDVYVETHGSTVMSKGKPIAIQAIARDITERKRKEEELQQTLESLRKAVGMTIQVMVSAVEARDPYTSGHQIRSANLARCIATEMGLPHEKIEGIRMAGSVHDIGKLSIPAEILSKPTKLTDLEFSLIKEHSRQGYEILKNVESSWPLAEIVYQHHERMDGSGYPRNLKGEDICIEARILSVADVVEAMASHRPYRPGLGINAALNEIEKNKGTLYDSSTVDACLRLFREKRFQFEGT